MVGAPFREALGFDRGGLDLCFRTLAPSLDAAGGDQAVSRSGSEIERNTRAESAYRGLGFTRRALDAASSIAEPKELCGCVRHWNGQE